MEAARPNKGSQAEIMFSLLTEHQKEQKTRYRRDSRREVSEERDPPSHAPRRGPDPLTFDPAGKSSNELWHACRFWEQQLRIFSERNVDGSDPRKAHEVEAWRLACREAYRILLVHHGVFAYQKGVNLWLWQSWYSEIDELQRSLKCTARTTGKSGALHQGSKPMLLDAAETEWRSLKEKLRALFGKAKHYYTRLVRDMLQSREVEVKSDGNAQVAFGRSLQDSFIALGDLSRYSEIHNESKQKDWSPALSFYQRALGIWAGNGKVYNQLAVIATYEKDNLSAVYYYCRALCSVDPFPARENIISLLERTRVMHHSLTTSKSFKSSVSGPVLGLGDAVQDFRLAFLCAACVCFTKIDLDSFQGRRIAMSSSLDDLNLVCFRRIEELRLGAEAHSRMGSEKSVHTENMRRLIRSMTGLFCKSVVIGVFLVQSSQTAALGQKAKNDRKPFKIAPEQWESSTSYLPSLQLLVTVVSRLAGIAFVSLHRYRHQNLSKHGMTSTEQSASGLIEILTVNGPALASINIFLDWIRWYPELLLLDLDGLWTDLRKVTVQLLNELLIYHQRVARERFLSQYGKSNDDTNVENLEVVEIGEDNVVESGPNDTDCSESVHKAAEDGSLESTRRQIQTSMEGEHGRIIRKNELNWREAIDLDKGSEELNELKKDECHVDVEDMDSEAEEEDATDLNLDEIKDQLREVSPWGRRDYPLPEDEFVRGFLPLYCPFSISKSENIRNFFNYTAEQEGEPSADGPRTLKMQDENPDMSAAWSLAFDRIDRLLMFGQFAASFAWIHIQESDDEREIMFTEEKLSSASIQAESSAANPKSTPKVAADTVKGKERMAGGVESPEMKGVKEQMSQLAVRESAVEQKDSNPKDLANSSVASNGEQSRANASSRPAGLLFGVSRDDIEKAALEAKGQASSTEKGRKKSSRRNVPGSQPTKRIQHITRKPTKKFREEAYRHLPYGAQPPLIVIDAPNVAMRHGMNRAFSSRGIELAIQYYQTRGHPVLAFLPEHDTTYEEVAKMKRLARTGFDAPPSRIPDDVSLLRKLVDRGVLITTPSHDYDDSYCIQYARTRNGCVVTNDQYRDAVENLSGKEEKSELRAWLRNHRISFTWVGDEFLPNPDFRFPVH